MDLFSEADDRTTSAKSHNAANSDLCMDLLLAENQERVKQVLEDAGYWDNKEAWRPYGDVESNYSTIGNQTQDADTALVEKLVNSVDAVLMGECLARGINPDSPLAPQSIQDALATFFGVPDGKLTNLDGAGRSRLAQNIFLVATGSRESPCLTVIDRGEGQLPASFPDTLLSLHQSNKSSIPFVQGQFDMGGTAALPFCGDLRLELIVSKRRPEIVQSTHVEGPNSGSWGFTVVRRCPPTGKMKNSVFEYLAPASDGSVLSFPGDSINALPDTAQGIAWHRPLEYGTIVKMYQFELPPRYRTDIKLDLSYRLPLLLPDIGMPVRVVECRGYGGHSPASTLTGVTVRLSDDRSAVLEDSFPGSLELNVDHQHMTATVYALRKGKEPHYLDTEGVILARNGQRRDAFSRDFFERKSVDLSYVARSTLVVVDCSSLSRDVAEDFFMNSRDRARRVPFRKHLEEELERQLHDHEGLRELNRRRREGELQESLGDQKPLQDVLDHVLSRVPELATLLKTGLGLASPAGLRAAPTTSTFRGKRFPTFFLLVSEHMSHGRKQAPRNRRFRVQFKTDAVNDFLSRSDEPGVFRISADGNPVGAYSLNLWNGTATLTVSLPDGCQVGQVIKYHSTLTSEDRVLPFETEFSVVVEPEETRLDGAVGRRKGPAGSGKTGNNMRPDEFRLPPVSELHRDELAKHGMDENDALKVMPAEDGFDFYVNIDNRYLENERRRNSKEDPRILERQFECGLVIIALLLLNAKPKAVEGVEAQEPMTAEEVGHVVTTLAPAVIPIARVLGHLDVADVATPSGNIDF